MTADSDLVSKVFNSINKNTYWIVLQAFLLAVICIMMHVPKVCADLPPAEKTPVHFSINKEKVLSKSACRFNKYEFEMILTSPSGDPLEDDTSLWFVQARNPVEANPGRPGYITFFTASLKSTSICKTATVFKLSNGYLAVPLFISNRPGLDLLSVAVYDPKKHRVLEYAILESFYGEKPTFDIIKNGFSYLAVSAQPGDGPEGMIETWLNVTWSGKQLIRKWDRTRPEVRH